MTPAPPLHPRRVRPAPFSPASWVALVLALQACTGASEDQNLLVTLSIDPALVADCAEVEVTGAAGERANALVSLAAGRPEWAVGVKRGSLPAQVTVKATAYTGACADTGARRLSSRATPVEATFPPFGVAEVKVALGLPPVALDADRDGYVAQREGGADCGDDNAAVHPGAPQLCSSTLDTDCDALVHCDDPDCVADPACAHPATSLAFTPPTVARVAGGCWPLTLELKAADGPAPAARPTALALETTAGDLQLFSDAACATLATRLPLAFGQRTAQVYGRADKVGASTATATDLSPTRSLGAATLTFTAVNHRVVLEGVPPAMASGQCSGKVNARLVNASGQPFPVTATTQVAVTAAGPAGDGVEFFLGSDTCAGQKATRLDATLVTGASGFSFSFRPTRPGRVLLDAVETGQPAQAEVEVGPGQPHHVFVPTGAAVTAGQCSGPIELELRDSAETPTSAPVPLALQPTATVVSPAGLPPSTVQLFTDERCTAPAGTALLPAGQSRTRVSFRSLRAPVTFDLSLAVTPSPGSGPVAGTAQWRVQPGAPVALAVVDGGVPALPRDGCSTTPLQVELRDELGNRAGAPRAEDVVWGPGDAGVLFFAASGATCPSTPLSVTPLVQDQEAVGVVLGALGSAPSPVTVVATSASWGSVQVTLPVAEGPGHLELRAPAQLEAGACLPVTVARRRESGGPAVLGEVTVTVVSPDAAVTVHPDAACASSGPAQVTLAAGQSTGATLYVAGHSAPSRTVTLTASAAPADLLPAQADVVALPLVRRGTCTVPLAAATVTCPLTPALPGADLSRTFFVYQASPSAWTPTDAAVECHLALDATLVCSRAGTNSLTAVDVAWQAVSFGRAASAGGVTVRHLWGQAPALPTWTHTFPEGDAARSFVLFGNSRSGNTIGGDDFATARLEDAGVVALTTAPAWGLSLGYSVQVVEFGGASVVRGQVLGGQDAVVEVSPTAEAPVDRTVALSTARLEPSADDVLLCKRRYTTEVRDGGSLAFSRGAGVGTPECTAGTLAELAWERVVFPPGVRVQPFTVTLPTGAPQGQVTLPAPLALDRTVVFSGSMGPSGQGGAELDWLPSPEALAAGMADNLGAAAVVLGLAADGGAVTVGRGYPGDAGAQEVVTTRVAGFAVQFQP